MEGQWESGLFSHVCGGDCGTCLGSWFCSPCLFGRTAQRLSKFPETNKENFDGCTGDCWGFYGASCFGLQWLLAMFKRTELRERFGIRGDGCNDCMASFCCTPCVLAQMETELKERAAKTHNGQYPVDLKQGQYAAPNQGMAYQAHQPPQ